MAPPPPKPIVVSNKEVNGPIHKFPCPWCGKPNDLRGIAEAIGATFEAGNKIDCDSCHHYIIITRVVPVVVVAGRQSKDQKLAPPTDITSSPATAITPRPR